MVQYSETGLTLLDTLYTNSIVWIHSLPEGEDGPTRRILEDLSLLLIGQNHPVLEYAVKDQTEFLNVLAGITDSAKRGLRPILHVDMHGSEVRGLQFSPSGDTMDWTDTIKALRELNVATENNLVCIFALCYGLHLYKHVNVTEPVPAYYFCAPKAEITVGALEEKTLLFYKKIFETDDISRAFKETLGEHMDSYHCQGLFFQTLLGYILRHCQGKPRRERLEKMVTRFVKDKPSITTEPGELSKARKFAKTSLKPGQHVIDQFAPRFLIGRPVVFTYKDIERALTYAATKGR